MILASGVRGPGLNSQNSPSDYLLKQPPHLLLTALPAALARLAPRAPSLTFFFPKLKNLKQTNACKYRTTKGTKCQFRAEPEKKMSLAALTSNPTLSQD